MLEIIWQILAVVTVFTLVVGFHELGHYLFARLYKIDVEEFAVGLGPKVLSKKSRSGTVFAIRALPLGGFVRPKGAEPLADGSEVYVKGGFFSRGPWRRGVVYLAGPVFSFLLGIICFFSLPFFYGSPSDEPVIGEVLNDGPAKAAGLQAGDRILEIDGQAVTSYHQMREIVRPAAQSLNFLVERDGAPQTIPITPQQKLQRLTDAEGNMELGPDGAPITKEMGFIGAAPALERFAFAAAFRAAWRDSAMVVSQTMMVLFNWQRLKEEAGGPIAIVQATSEVAKAGVRPLIPLAGIISLSLGILNLLPIPLLDGGQIVIAIIEGLRGGKRLSLKIQSAVATAGLGLLLLIMISVFALDIGRLMNPEKPRPAAEGSKQP